MFTKNKITHLGVICQLPVDSSIAFWNQFVKEVEGLRMILKEDKS